MPPLVQYILHVSVVFWCVFFWKSGTTNITTTWAKTATRTTTSSPLLIDTRKYADICVQPGKSMYGPLKEKDGRGHAILKLAIQVSTLASIVSKDSPQHKAMCWMIYDDVRKLDPRGGKVGSFLDRYALVTLYMNTKGPGWVRSDYWLTKEHECTWYGISCTRTGLFLTRRITGLDLSFNKVSGLLPRELAFLSELRLLDLNGNELQGVIPHLMLSRLTKLEKLHLHMNDLFGNVPTEMGNLKNLKELTIFGNFFFGSIPSEIGNLKKLKILDLYANNLTGSIPSNLGQMKKLRELYVNDNDLKGKMPKEICNLKLQGLTADCLGNRPEVQCDCCLICCQGLPDPKCKDMRSMSSSQGTNSSNKKQTSMGKSSTSLTTNNRR